jgi:hypothetical protein
MATVCVKKLREMQYRSTDQPLTSGLADTRSLAMLARSTYHLHGVLRQSRVTRHDTSVDITLVKRTRALSVKLQSPYRRCELVVHVRLLSQLVSDDIGCQWSAGRAHRTRRSAWTGPRAGPLRPPGPSCPVTGSYAGTQLGVGVFALCDCCDASFGTAVGRASWPSTPCEPLAWAGHHQIRFVPKLARTVRRRAGS